LISSTYKPFDIFHLQTFWYLPPTNLLIFSASIFYRMFMSNFGILLTSISLSDVVGRIV
jgi:hypothetical protein